MIFDTYKIADINLHHLRETDIEILLSGDQNEVPFFLARTSGGRGVFMYIFTTDDIEQDLAYIDNETEIDYLSDNLISILLELRKQNIAYVRFDCDGALIPGLETFEK